MRSHHLSGVLEQEFNNLGFQIQSCLHELGLDHIYDEKPAVHSKPMFRDLDMALREYYNIKWNNDVKQ